MASNKNVEHKVDPDAMKKEADALKKATTPAPAKTDEKK
jgi:hypothetical protein